MNKFCDLHTHSVFSDGTCTPGQLIDEAAALGLSAIALTDHNTVDGLSEFLAAAEGKDILAIPGVEFSTDYDGTELHLLGLFIYPAQFPAIQLVTRDYLRRKDESNRELVASLNTAGYELDYEKNYVEKNTDLLERNRLENLYTKDVLSNYFTKKSRKHTEYFFICSKTPCNPEQKPL